VAAVLAAAGLLAAGRTARGEDQAAARPALPADVARILDEADHAFLGGDLPAAQAGYGRVLARVPDCKAALWGRAVALLRLGRDYQAWPLLDAALGPDPGPEACRAAARVTMAADPASLPSERLAIARRYLDLATRGAPAGRRGRGRDSGAGAGAEPVPEALAAQVWVAQESGDTWGAVRAWQTLVARWPEWYALMAPPAMRGDEPPASSPAAAPAFPRGGDWERVRLLLLACLGLGAAWAVGLGGLFVAGDALSRATVRLADREGGGRAIPRGHAAARWLYRAVIRGAAAYYDVSLVVFTALVSAVPIGMFYGLATSSRVPGWAVLAAVPLGVGWVLLLLPLARSVRVRVIEQADGRPLRESDAPALWALAADVARVVGIRPVDEIRLVTGATIGVYERGRPRDKRRGRATRCLILGMATFDDFPLRVFRAVMAHEFAHLLHRDTARPPAALRLAARLNLTRAWISFWRGDAWWNLGWHFVSAYDRFFCRVTHGANRFAEVHADRVAALAYGVGPATDGLLLVIRRDAEHQESQDRAVRTALGIDDDAAPQLVLRNLRAIRSRSIADRIRAEVTASPHDVHTHPTPARRLKLLEVLARELTDPARRDGEPGECPPEGNANVGGEGEEAGVWSLFADPGRARAEFQRRCAAEVVARLDAHAALVSRTVTSFTEAILDRPDQADPYFARAEVLFDLGDLPAARRDLDAGLERNEWNARAWFLRGQLGMRLGDPAGAAEDLRRAMSLARVAFEPAVQSALGDLAAVAGDLDGAIAAYGRSIELDRTNPEIFLKRAAARLRLGHAAQAADDFSRAAALDPSSAEAHLGLAAARRARADHVQALDAARAALALDPSLPDAHLLLARLLLDPDRDTPPDVPLAIVHARKARALGRGTDPEADELLARALALSETVAPPPRA
jgi:tetratricopeptide (TPR) repeat protein